LNYLLRDRSTCVSKRRRSLLAAAFTVGVSLYSLVIPTTAAARDLYVSPNGSSSNDGSASRPLDLTKALSPSSPAKAGDTIWLRGGTYRGTYVSDLTGTASAPIIVRQYPGERAIIDTNPSQSDGILARGAYTWFWGFEITNSNPNRYSSQTGSWPTDVPRGYGVTARGRALKFINMVVHDMANGFGVWIESVDTEVYGSIAYNNGWQAPDRAHGHGIYAQNQSGRMRLTDNILFNQFSHGLHGYGSGAAFLDYITMEGNIAFNNGIISKDGLARELLLGGGVRAASPEVKSNSTYGAQVNVGYGAGCTNAQVTGNYFVGTGVAIVNCAGTVTGNTMYSIYGVQTLPTSHANNTFLSTPPTSATVRVRPNRYEAGRAHIAVYNWQDKPQVSLDLSGTGLTVGQSFEIRDAQNYFGSSPVFSGVYNGSAVTIPMSGLTVGVPVGTVPVAPRHTAPRFGAFVVVPTSGASQPPPTTSAPPTATLSASPQSIAAGASSTLTWSTAQAATVTLDPLGAVAVNGTVTVSPTQTTTYTLTAKSSSGGSVTKTVTITVTSGNTANKPPTVAVSAPAHGTTMVAPASLTVTVAASDADGSIAHVKFYRNGTLMGTDTTSPYSTTWTGVPGGTYSITAQATDDKGAVSSSAAVAVTVNASPTNPTPPPTNNRAPVGYLISPASGATYAKAPLRLEAIATDFDGKISKVEFFDGTVLIKSVAAAPYIAVWTPTTSGAHTLSVKTTDNAGATSTSKITVTIR
jgi:hypothetical protein